MKPNGAVLWEGGSLLTGDPIQVIATGLRRPSRNRKTGRMVQTWIVPRDQDPITAARTGLQEAVCGDCPLQVLKGGGCYVSLLRGPNGAHRAGYALEQGLRTPYPVRMGAWGDPVAAPYLLWKGLAGRHTGYTHQWHWPHAWRYRRFLMASVQSKEERKEAKARGFRTYRILEEGEGPGSGEILCPYVTHKVQCADCRLCDGGKQGKDICIPAHGPAKRRVHG